MCSVVLLYDICANAASLGDLESLIHGPRPYRRALAPRRHATGWPSATGAASSLDKGLQQLPHSLPVRWAQIDLIGPALKAEAHSLGRRRTIEVVGNEGIPSLRHLSTRQIWF